VAALLLLAVGGGLYYQFGRTPAPVSQAAVNTAPEPPVAAEPAPKPVEPPPVPVAAPPPSRPATAPAATPKPKPPAEPKPVKAPAPKPEPAPAPPPVEQVQKEVPPDLQGLFEKARSATIAGDYLAAVAGFELVLKWDPNYPNANNLLGVARGGAKNAAQLAVDAGDKAQMTGDYAGARKQYERARELDPQAPAVSSAMRRLAARMQGEGEAAFKTARQYDATGKTKEAIATYETALQLLPADHENVKAARERIAALKGGA
jgi:tetratricopeptide (TPR) repeat protein